MSIITTSSFAKSLWPGVNAMFQRAYKEKPEQWVKLFDKYTSDKNYEEDVGYSGFGLLTEKSEGQGINYDSQRQGFTVRYRHLVYALGFIITREMMEDDLYIKEGQKKANALAFSARQTKEIVAANVYNRAFNSAYLGGDGVQMISSSHPNIAGGTWSNTLSTAADLSEASLEQARIDISQWTDDRGLRIAITPQMLIVPPQLEFEANRILKSVGRVGTDNNDINALNQSGIYKEIVVNNYLTDTDAWFIRTDSPDGMKYFERRAGEFTQDNDFDTENAKFKFTERYSFGWSDPRGIYGSPGA